METNEKCDCEKCKELEARIKELEEENKRYLSYLRMYGYGQS